MDRRQRKTHTAILGAFRSLLESTRYDRITVQDILEKADVGRSTFYAHFETKDRLLDALCEELFYPLFANDPCPFAGKDDDLEAKLSHTLWHIRDAQNDLTKVLLSDSGDLFMGYFKGHLRRMFEQYITYFHIPVPREFLLDHLVGSFAETVQWWMREKMQTPPETVARYFLTVTETHNCQERS